MEHGQHTQAVIAHESLGKRQRPNSPDWERVPPTALKTNILLPTKKTIARISTVNHKMLRKNLKESEGLFSLCPDSEKVAQSDTLAKIQTKNSEMYLTCSRSLQRTYGVGFCTFVSNNT